MSLDRPRTFRFVALAAVPFTYATMVLGGYVKAIGAGLACPDWPLCYGSAVPDLGDPQIAAEWTHRFVAMAAGLLVFASLVLVLWWFRSDRVLTFLASASVMLLAAQVTVGALTITSNLDPVVVTGHLALATAVFGFVLLVAVRSLRMAAANMAEAREAA